MEGGDEYDGIREYFPVAGIERNARCACAYFSPLPRLSHVSLTAAVNTAAAREARDVRVADRTMDQVSSLTVREAHAFFGSLEMTDKEAAIADKVLKEIRRRLAFLTTSARLSHAGSPFVHALGRGSAANQPRHVIGVGARRHVVRARRAVHRAAFARQPAAHYDSSAVAGSGQHRHRGRRRCRHDQSRRPHRRSASSSLKTREAGRAGPARCSASARYGYDPRAGRGLMDLSVPSRRKISRERAGSDRPH